MSSMMLRNNLRKCDYLCFYLKGSIRLRPLSTAIEKTTPNTDEEKTNRDKNDLEQIRRKTYPVRGRIDKLIVKKFGNYKKDEVPNFIDSDVMDRYKSKWRIYCANRMMIGWMLIFFIVANLTKLYRANGGYSFEELAAMRRENWVKEYKEEERKKLLQKENNNN